MKKRFLALLLVVVLVLSLTACKGGSGSGDGGKSDTKESQYKTTYGAEDFGGTEISVEIFDRSNAPEGSTSTDNKWTHYAQEAMEAKGIKLSFVSVPRADEVTKMTTMMASGTAPTILGTYTWSYCRDYMRNDGIWDLAPFVDGEDQAKNLKAYLGENCLELGRDTDGKLIGIVARRATVALQNLFIREDWLKTLGIEIPTTVEQYHDAIAEIVAKNPGGQPNTIGMEMGVISWSGDYNTTTYLYNPFNSFINDEKSQAVGYVYYTDPHYIDYLKYLNSFYNEGLTNSEFFAATEEQLKSNFVNSKLGSFSSNVGYNVDILRGNLLMTLKENDPEAEMVAIKPLENLYFKGEYPQGAYGEGGMMLYFPKTYNEKQVAAGITYLDWMGTKDGGFVFYHGFEGEHFEYNENNVPIPKDADYNKVDKDWLRTDIFLIGNQGYFQTVDEFNQAIAADNPGWESYTIQDYEYSMWGKLLPQAQYMYSPQSALDAQTDITLVNNEWGIKCITCKPEDVQANYDQWMADLESKGNIKKVIEDTQAVYDEVRGGSGN